MLGPARLGGAQRPAVLFPQFHRFLENRVVGEASGDFLPPWLPQSRLLLQTLLQTSDLDFQCRYSRLKLFRCHCVRSLLRYLYHSGPTQPNAFRHKRLTIPAADEKRCEVTSIEAGRPLFVYLLE
jgi:hypothetical protein